MSTSKKIRTVAALGLLSSAVWAGTFAAFSDDATSTSTFSTGTVDLELTNEVDDAYDFATLSTANMKPGDVKYAALTVENAGTLPAEWTMTSTESEAVLSGALQLGAVTGAATCNALGYSTAAAVPLGVNVVIAEGDLSAAAVSTPRALAAGGSEVLCVKVELPSSVTDNALQGLTSTSTFAFNLAGV